MNTELDGRQTTNWSEVISKRAAQSGRSVIRELLEVASKPEIISFAGGLPASETLPLAGVADVVDYFNRQDAKEGKSMKKVLQYCSTEGIEGLRNYLSKRMCQYGINAETDNILPTSGSQQALDLLGRAFLDPGDVIISSAPTYTGAIQAFNYYQPEFVTVELDQDGMKVDQVEKKLEKHDAKFIYVLPNFHNPGGVTLSKERRKKLVKVAAENDTFIVEDDPYGELRFKGSNITPILPLHKENVVYLSTFSKTLAPSLRLGWVTAPQPVIDNLVKMKQGADLCTAAFLQYVVLYLCRKEGFLEKRRKRLRELYKKRRDAMIAGMEQHFPEQVKWTHPQGGLFLWVTVEGCDTEELFDVALDHYNVAFVFGSAFFPNQESSNSMRLNFSYMGEEKIKEGIRKLGNAINKFL